MFSSVNSSPNDIRFSFRGISFASHASLFKPSILSKYFNSPHRPYWLVSVVGNASPRSSFKTPVLKAKYNFQFFWLCARYIVAQLSYRRGQTWCQNYLTRWRAEFDPICQPNQRYPSSLSIRVYSSLRRGCVREMHHRNWTWDAISLLATEVQVDWGLSLHILIFCLKIGEHGL